MKKLLSIVLLIFLLVSCARPENPEVSYAHNKTNPTFGIDTTWTKKVLKTNPEWEKILTPQQYYILREAGTERPFTSPLNNNKKEGVYSCAACGNVLFSSETKFKSGTGWPSFYQPYFSKSVDLKQDYSHGMVREEVLCARCDGHLGHVFNDGPNPTGLRYCINGDALEFQSQEELDLKTAYFAQGCFWCVEEIFEALVGVKEVISGYAGGTEKNPNYKAVGRGETGHAEAVKIIYNPKEISFEQLLDVYYHSGDITQVNGQGPDHGTQYRSILFYETEEEKEAIESSLKIVKESGEYSKPIAIEIQKFTTFYEAEEYHQDFVKRNPNQGYVQAVSIPRFKKASKHFPELLRKTKE